MKSNLIRAAQYGGIILIAAAIFGLVTFSTAAPRARALPEYAARTGEPCATCHVSPGGGGPRTLRGLLWAARGRPDEAPTLPNLLIAPGATEGLELYDVACAACHGRKGEGLFGATLANSSLRESKIRSAITRGRARSGMPAFEGQFTGQQLDTLVTYVAGLSNGKIDPPPDTYPLESGKLLCQSNPAPVACGGN